jgi:hypothetical protein
VIPEASFGANFWPNLWSNLLAGLVVVALAYFFVELRLHLRQRREDQEQERAHEWETIQTVLRAVQEELTHNTRQAELVVSHAQEEELPYPAFETNGWHLIAQSPVFMALHEATLRRLLRVYNRLRSANEYYDKTYDFLFGSTAVLAVVGIESMSDETARTSHQRAFTEKRATMLKELSERVRELQPYLDDAVNFVSQELAGPPPGTDPADVKE